MIDSNKVEELFLNCLFKEDENVEDYDPIIVEGIMATFGLHPDRVRAASDEIKSWLQELPEEFQKGWSFLNLCVTKDGQQWTGLHMICEQLMVLGMAIGKIKYCVPREMWSVLPGGMPYIFVEIN
jgi:hypothetical protein